MASVLAPAGRSDRACTACASSRVKCSRGSPCARCLARNVDCIYPSIVALDDSSTMDYSAAVSAAVAGAEPDLDLGNDLSGLDQSIQDCTSSLLVTRTTNWLTPSFSGDGILTSSVGGLDMGFLMGNMGTTNSTNMNNVSLQTPMDAAINMGMAQPAEGIHVHDQMSAMLPQYPQASSSSIAFDGAVPNSFQNQLGVTDPSSLNYTDIPGITGITPTFMPASSPSSTNCFSYVNGQGTRTPFIGRQIPYGGHSSSPLTVRPEMLSFSATAYEAMVAELTSNPGEMPFPEGFPTWDQFQQYTASYFEHFHCCFPFLHSRSFFAEASSDWTLFLAVVATGATYCIHGPADKEVLSHKETLLGFLDRVLRQKRRQSEDEARAFNLPWIPNGGKQDEQIGADLPTVQAHILWVVSMLYGGTSSRVRLALQERRRLVNTCQAMGLLSESPGGIWRTKLEQERYRRTGFMIWFLDCYVSYSFDCDALLRLEDIRTPLPCHEDIWNADDPDLSKAEPLLFVKALEKIYIGHQLPANITGFSQLLLVYGICRHTKEVVTRLQGSRLATWVPHGRADSGEFAPQGQQSQQQILAGLASAWRNSACDSFDVLHWRANSRIGSNGGWEHPTVLHLHLARMLVLSPTSAILTAAASHTDLRHGTASCAEVIRNWVKHEPFRVRLCLIHAGGVMWHIRRFSSKGFVEPFAIYLAVLLVWAYSKTVNDIDPIDDGDEAQDAEPAYATSADTGDSHPCSGSQGSHPSQEERDIPRPSVEVSDTKHVNLDRPLDDELVQKYVSHKYRMNAFISPVGDIRAKAAPEKILREGIRLLKRKSMQPTTVHPGGVVNDDGTREPGLWGIEASYIVVLGRLADLEKSRHQEYHQFHQYHL